jgi:hypothetical protein
MIGSTELAILAFFLLFIAWMYIFAKDQNQFEQQKRQEKATHEYYEKQNEKHRTCPTKHANADLRLQRYAPPEGGGRLEVERMAAEDIKYGINREYHREMNCYGLITWYCPDCGMTTPVTCMHGGSMWMCPSCYWDIVKRIEQKEQNKLLETAGVGGH